MGDPTGTTTDETARRAHALLGHASCGTRELPEEVPVALVYDGTTLAVMMTTPDDLVDFAAGFTLTEGLSSGASEVEIVHRPNGIECRVALDAAGRHAFERRRRSTTGGSSCGLCGVTSLAQAIRVPPSVCGQTLRLAVRDVHGAIDALRDHQPLHDRTRAAHAAGFFVPGRGLVAVREDVGRHNALDKLVGAVVRAGVDPASGAVVLTSRVSIEMVQKAAAFGAPAIIAVSAPTALAVRTARVAGQTLVGNVRGGRHEVFSHAFRLGVRQVSRTGSADSNRAGSVTNDSVTNGIDANGVDANGADKSRTDTNIMDTNGVNANGVDANGADASRADKSRTDAHGTDVIRTDASFSGRRSADRRSTTEQPSR